jgi:hypothetical protein
MTTPIAVRNRRERGQVKGQPLRFVNGHNKPTLGRRLSPEHKAKRELFT